MRISIMASCIPFCGLHHQGWKHQVTIIFGVMTSPADDLYFMTGQVITPHWSLLHLQGPRDVYLGLTGAIVGTLPTSLVRLQSLSSLLWQPQARFAPADLYTSL